MKSTGLANFLCVISSKSQRPQSILGTASAAIGHLYKAKNMNPEIVRKVGRWKNLEMCFITTYIVKNLANTMNLSFVRNRFAFKVLFYFFSLCNEAIVIMFYLFI